MFQNTHILGCRTVLFFVYWVSIVSFCNIVFETSINEGWWWDVMYQLQTPAYQSCCPWLMWPSKTGIQLAWARQFLVFLRMFYHCLLNLEICWQLRHHVISCEVVVAFHYLRHKGPPFELVGFPAPKTNHAPEFLKDAHQKRHNRGLCVPWNRPF